jgi:hypothetical protein
MDDFTAIAIKANLSMLKKQTMGKTSTIKEIFPAEIRQ